MNLDVYKAEIFRRSQRLIKRRKTIRNRVLALCIPLVLVTAGVLFSAQLIMEKDEADQAETLAQASDHAAGSIFCSYVQAELYVAGEAVTVADKLTVDKLFSIAAFSEDDGDVLHDYTPPTEAESATEHVAGRQPGFGAAETSNCFPIYFTTAEGVTEIYFLTQEQYARILEVLE